MAALAGRMQDPAAPARVVHVDAVALDRANNPVTDLRREDLEVWIGGYRVPIATLTAVTPETAAPAGRLIVLLLDDVTLEPAMVARAREIARRFVTRMPPGDRMAIAMLSGGTMEIGADQPPLLRRIDSVRLALGVIPIDQIGAQLLTTVAGVARAITEAPEPRKTIVAIGSGWLLDTPVPPPEIGRDLRPEWYDALRALAVANATYYVIEPLGVGPSRTVGSTGFARETGGHAFTNTNDFAAAVDRIFRETTHYYTITVGDPPVGRKANLRELDVRTSRRGVTVRARRSIPGGG